MNRRRFVRATGAAFAIAFLFGSSHLAQAQTTPQTTAPTPQAAPVPRLAEHVFVISFDGGKPSVMRQSRMPMFFKMLGEGAGTLQAQTVFPSITLVSHASMLTGVGPDKHKISWNEWTPDKGMVAAPTIFQIAKKHDKKLTTAMFVGKQKFAHLFLPGSLDAWSLPDYTSRIVAQQAADYIKTKKPNLCFIHFSDSDGAGHEFGWGSGQQIQAFADEDDALKVLRDAIKKAGIEKSSLIILTADHGGHAKTHGSNSPDDMTIPWVIWGAGVKKSFALTAPITTFDSAATALYALGIPIPAEFDGKPVVSAFQSPIPVVMAPAATAPATAAAGR